MLPQPQSAHRPSPIIYLTGIPFNCLVHRPGRYFTYCGNPFNTWCTDQVAHLLIRKPIYLTLHTDQFLISYISIHSSGKVYNAQATQEFAQILGNPRWSQFSWAAQVAQDFGHILGVLGLSWRDLKAAPGKPQGSPGKPGIIIKNISQILLPGPKNTE